MGRMTREQAIKILRPMLDSFVDYANITMKIEDDNNADALEMAIEALEQPEIIRCKDCKHNPQNEWFGRPMANLSEQRRPEDAWCWKGRTDGSD